MSGRWRAAAACSAQTEKNCNHAYGFSLWSINNFAQAVSISFFQSKYGANAVQIRCMGGPWAVYGRAMGGVLPDGKRGFLKNATKRYVQASAIACEAILAVNLGGKRASYQIVPAGFTTIKLIALRVKNPICVFCLYICFL